MNSRLEEAHELLPSLLGLVRHDCPVGLSLHAPQTHGCLCCDESESGGKVKTISLFYYSEEKRKGIVRVKCKKHKINTADSLTR